MTRFWMRMHAAIVARLPRGLRDEYADEIQETFARRVAERSRHGRLAASVEAALGCADVARVLLRQRMGAPTGWREGLTLAAPREALTSLRRSPWWSGAVVLTLALGIGATTTMFSVLWTVVLRPLPYPDAAQLVRVGSVREGRPAMGSVSGPNFRDLQSSAGSLTGVAASTPASMAVGGDDAPAEAVRGGFVSGSFFPVLGVRAARGRLLTPDDDRPGAAPAVVLSDGLWRDRFGARASVVGEVVRLDGRSFEVVGVLSATFQPPEGAHLRDTRLWAPLAHSPFPVSERALAFLDVIARLRPNTSIPAARAEIDGIGRSVALQHDLQPRAFETFRIERLHDETVGSSAASRLALLMGAVALLLLITCTNVAQLMLARTAARSRELAVRAAIGGGRWRIGAYVLWQPVWLALAGGAAGLGASTLGVAAVRRWAPVDLPRLAELRVDLVTLVFAAGLAGLTGLAVGLVPALRATRRDVVGALRGSSRTTTGDRHRSRLRDGLVVVQTAIGLVLLAGAALLTRSLVHLERVDPGFDATDLLVVSARLADATDAANHRVPLTSYEALLDAVASVPGVRSASLTTGAPFASGGWTTYVQPTDRTLGEDELRSMRVGLHQISAGHLTSMGVRLGAGRGIEATDRGDTDPVAVVSQSLADHLWPGRRALDQSIVVGGDGTFTPRRIVGVVEAPLYTSRRAPDEWHVYLPYTQFPPPQVDLLVRATPSPSLAASLRAAVFASAADAPLLRVTWMRELMAREMVEPRFLAGLLGSLAGIAVVLAALGILGALAYAVEQRRHEMGVRMALGAGRGRVSRLIVGRAVVLVSLGVGIGLVATLGAARALEAFVFGVTTTDVPTIAFTTVVVVAAAAMAAWLPARHVARIDPSTALQAD